MYGEKGLRRRIRDTKVKEEKRIRCEIEGADRAKGENKMHDGQKM